MRLIDADELNKVKFHPLPYTHIVPADLLKCQTEAYERGWNDAIDAIMESAPTVDAVEVVRCKDCKWYNTTASEKCVAYDAFWTTEPDDYCAWGERREDEQTQK